MMIFKRIDDYHARSKERYSIAKTSNPDFTRYVLFDPKKKIIDGYDSFAEAKNAARTHYQLNHG